MSERTFAALLAAALALAPPVAAAVAPPPAPSTAAPPTAAPSNVAPSTATPSTAAPSTALPAPFGARSAPAAPSPSAPAPATVPASSIAQPAPSGTPGSAGADFLVRGRYLVCERGFIVLTNGAALRLENSAIAVKGKIGETVRLRVDPMTRLVRSIERSPRAVLPGEIEAGALPVGFITATAQTPPPNAAGGAAEAAAVAVTIVARIPDDTPLTDEVYLSTERSAFNPAELRLVRVDSRHWTIDLSLPLGSTLHYRFTRGSFATGERDRAGALVAPHTLVAAPGLQAADTVERWADRN